MENKSKLENLISKRIEYLTKIGMSPGNIELVISGWRFGYDSALLNASAEELLQHPLVKELVKELKFLTCYDKNGFYLGIPQKHSTALAPFQKDSNEK